MAVAACRPAPRMSMPRSRVGLAVGTVALGLSNVHVVFGTHPVLIDTGSPGEAYELEKRLRQLGVRLSDIKCAVVTHGHADHAGGARALQQRGIKIIAGSGDLWREIRGVHGKLRATSFFARLLKVIIPDHYQAFWPDVRVKKRYDLHDCGLDGEAVVVGAHTAGSLVVIAGSGKIAFVGDLFRGGALAGYIHRGEPKEHFYQEDLPLAHQRIRYLLALGVEYFILGHGGPAKRADVARVFGR
ncbi:MAG TPA: MBL fold metallo-hydrolase [Kofleriaceae bacterium]|nr:MBL fold metallo-hydrolase [Kofleriaceae bacterium]